ncbi:MAG: methyltransferase domain-containing protein [Dongiaceae bacterium]
MGEPRRRLGDSVSEGGRGALPYWEARADAWRIVPPLSPAAEDVAWFEAVARRAAAEIGRAPRALLLGVTPAIAAMGWPPGTELVAVDWAEGMLRRVWPRQGTPATSARVRGDWRALPLIDAGFDLVLGDGCYSTFGHLAEAARAHREIRRVLRRDGLHAMRYFCRLEPLPSVEALLEDLQSGRFINLDLFRWLLAMAVQGDGPAGVELDSVWRTWTARVPDVAALRSRMGWTTDALANLRFWENAGVRFCFPSRAELAALVEPGFELLERQLPGYQPAMCFPRLLLRAR